jgi:PAS domain S-box-containing protein
MNFGFGREAVWIKLPVQNVSGSAMRWFLQINYPTLNDVQLFVVQNNQIVNRLEAGTDNIYKHKNIKNIFPSFDLTLDNSVSYHIYIRVKTNSVKIIPLSFTPIQKHEDYNLAYLLIEILLMGFVFGVGAYQITMYFLIHEKMYLFLGLVFLSLFLNFYVHYGYLFILNSWLSAFVKDRMVFFSLSSAYFWFILFSIYYLKIRHLKGNWNRISLFFLSLYCFLFLLSLCPFIPDTQINAMFMISYFFVWSFFVVLGLRTAATGSRPAIYFLISILLFFGSTLSYFLVVFGVLRFNYLLFHLTLIAAWIDALFLTLGLSQIIIFNALEKQKAEALAKDNLVLRNEIEVKLRAEHELRLSQIDLEKQYKKQTLRLEQEENHFKYLVENLSDWVWRINLKKKFTHNNYKLLKLLGYHEEELYDHPFLQIVEANSYNTVDVALSECLTNGNGFIDMPIMLIAKNQKLIPMEVSVEAIRDYDHSITGLLGISRDLRKRYISERQMLNAIHGAEENERRRLSTEIHDGIGPILSGIHLYLSTMLIGDFSSERNIELIKKAKQSIQDVSNELRHISNNLMPVEFTNHSLIENISLLVDRLIPDNKISCSIFSDVYTAHLSDENNLVIFRIISELLNNTIKHARATKIMLYFNNDDKEVRINYTDDGIGFDISKKLSISDGLGLRNIQSRLKIIDATYKFNSAPGEGMSLEFSFRSENEPILQTYHEST